MQRVAIVRVSRQLRFGQGQGLIDLPHIGQLFRVNHLHAVVFRLHLRRGLRGRKRILPLVRLAVGIHLAHVSVVCVIAAQIGHLLVGCHRIRHLVLLAVNVPQAIQESRAVPLLILRILALRIRRRIQDAGQHSDRLIVLAQGVIDQGFVVAHFFLHVRRGLRLRLLQRGQRIVVVPLQALDL